MDVLDAVDVDTILSGRCDWIGPDVAEVLSRQTLECIEMEFPHYVFSIDSPDEYGRPKAHHPIFFGCFDWHSAVHSHWSLIRQLRLFNEHPAAPQIRRRIQSRFTTENVARETKYFDDNPSFEKPYGWAWFLRLVAELHCWDDEQAADWSAVLRPLEERLVELVRTEFLTQRRPFRVGTHANSAFALQCVLDYAREVGNESLEGAVLERSRAFFLNDRNYPVEYEPLGWDFLSPALAEADLMRRVLEPEAFSVWIEGFLPDVTHPPYDAILDPVDVEPGSDGGIELHLVGLNLSKAWCLAGIASALGDHPVTAVLERSASRHAERGLELAFTDEYAGSHWLTSFVLYLVTRNESGIAPE